MNEYINKITSEYTKNTDLDLQKLAGDASHREYFIEKANNLIVCDYHDDKEGFNDFISIQKLFSKNDISVPEVKFSSFPVVVLENLGTQDLYTTFKENYYFESIKNLIKIQNLKTTFDFKTKEPAFTSEKFLWELNFAQEHLKKHLGLKSIEPLESEFKVLCDFLINDTRQVPTHRDFHSKNIMVSKGQQVFIIDFQDARMGPYLYDLASLIDDPYAQLKPSLKSTLLKTYCEQSNITLDSKFEKEFRLTSIQRIFKACGSFASQKNLKNKDNYLEYLKPSFKILMQSLELESQNFPKMKSFIETCAEALAEQKLK